MKTSFSTLKSMLVDLGADVVTEALRKYERAQAVLSDSGSSTRGRRRSAPFGITARLSPARIYS